MKEEIEEFRTELQNTVKEYGFELTEKQLEQFVTYRNELKRWNKRINLTAIKEDSEIIEKHFLDSISILIYIDLPVSAKVVDVGSGAGFPGLPLKILRQELNLVLIESVKKKAGFLHFITAKLKLDKVEVVNMRAEDFILSRPNDKFDLVLTRFLASIEDSIEYCIILLKSGGLFVAYKGTDVKTEIESAKPKIESLGADIVDIIKADITKQNRYFVIIKKSSLS